MEAFCILAAGKGMRLNKVTKLHKCLLSINNKAVISHIIDKAPTNAEIIIAVGHQSELVKEYCLAAHPDKKIIFVNVDNYDGPGSGPGYSLQCCKPLLQRPFTLICSDCIVTEPLPDLTNNWIGVFPVNDPINWSTAHIQENKVLQFKNKDLDGYKHAFIGVAGIKDYNIFWSQMKHTDKEYEMVSAFYNPQVYPELLAYPFSWHDTGTPENYQKSKEQLGQSSLGMNKEIDELTYKVNNRCIKIFGDSKIASGRIKRAESLKNIIPKIVFHGKHVYAYEWIAGGTMYEIGNLELFIKLLDWCETNLWIPKKCNNFKETCYKFYYEKTLQRAKTYLDKKNLQNDQYEIIQGNECKPINYYLEKLDWDDLCNGIPVLFHGDLQFENIIYTGNDFCLIDWRDSFADSLFGDIYYDFAKLYGGLEMCYQKIKEGKFEIKDGNYSFEVPSYLNEMKVYFENWLLKKGWDLNKIKILTALIYLNMAPLHTPDFDKLLFSHSKYLLNLHCQAI